MENRDPTLCRAFVARTKEILGAYPQIKHEWSIDADEDHCILDIPQSDPGGFDINVEVYPEQITVFGTGYHEHFTYDKEITVVESALGLVRDLLSPDMRIREYLAGGSPYRWDAESLRNGQWVREHTTGLFFWNYFGKRSQKFYQNKVLEGRLSGGASSIPFPKSIRNKPIKKLTDFPYLTVTSVKVVDKNWEVCGVFNKTTGMREDRFWLVKEDKFYIADLVKFDKDQSTGVMEVPYWEEAKELSTGDKLYCVTAYWNWDFMSYIADKNSVWHKVNFKPVDAQVFLNNGVRGWCRVNRKLSEGCIPTGEIIKNGWDHEHCDLCDNRIDNDAPIGYHDPNNLFWLCEQCYSTYAINGDLSFTGE